MAGQRVDQNWLKTRLSKTLGWDPTVAEGVVEAIATAGSQAEIDELLQDYMGGNQQAAELVHHFLSAQQGPFQSAASKQASASTSQAPGVRTDPRGNPLQPGHRAGGSVTVVHQAARKSKARAAQQEAVPRVERTVANCLQCGKIFHPLADTVESQTLIGSGGACTFCGAHVGLSHGDASEQRVAAAQRGAAEQASPQVAPEDPTAFKDRMVGYDRDSARRTQVLDDQSDYFDVDSNAWLSTEEREQLKAQDAAVREAEEARRKRVTVHIDLLGRQVLMEDDDPQTNLHPAADADSARQPSGQSSAARAGHAAASSAPAPGPGARPMVFRSMTNAGLRTPMPMFIKPPSTQQHDGPARATSQKPPSGSRGSTSRQAVGSSGKLHQSVNKPRRPARVQHDDPFETADLQLQATA